MIMSKKIREFPMKKNKPLKGHLCREKRCKMLPRLLLTVRGDNKTPSVWFLPNSVEIIP